MLSNTYPRKRSKNVSCVEGLGSLWGEEVTEGQSRSQRPGSFFQHMTKGTPGDEVDRGGVKKFPAPWLGRARLRAMQSARNFGKVYNRLGHGIWTRTILHIMQNV